MDDFSKTILLTNLRENPLRISTESFKDLIKTTVLSVAEYAEVQSALTADRPPMSVDDAQHLIKLRILFHGI